MIAGGIGGTTGDLLMHSLDTVKTRQQGDPHMPPKYTTLGASYSTIFRQEGISRGLYGGWLPALMGSFPGTVIFFGTYELSKRNLADWGCNDHFSHLTSGRSEDFRAIEYGTNLSGIGFVADLAASIVYVPSEVLKTRLQLQGRYNNPHFKSGYNYRGTGHALRTLIRTEGPAALFYGYGATLLRDLPFSALQFMFYEQGQKWSREWKKSKDIGVPLELATGAVAGGLSGVITCPLDVVKTRIQTQVNPTESASQVAPKPSINPSPTNAAPPQLQPQHLSQTSSAIPKHPSTPTARSQPASQSQASNKNKAQFRNISTSSPSTHTPKPGAIKLDTSNVFTGLKLIYKSEGVGGWFRGVGPRFLWTSVQSGIMLFCYQRGLKILEKKWPLGEEAVMESELGERSI